MFDTGRNLRENISLGTQTNLSTIASASVKEIALPVLNDYEIPKQIDHPFMSVLKFLNRDTEKKLKINIKPLESKDVFLISEAVLDRIGNELLKHSQVVFEENLIKGKGRPKSAKRRPRSPKKRKKGIFQRRI
jgi:hypothetical protein